MPTQEDERARSETSPAAPTYINPQDPGDVEQGNSSRRLLIQENRRHEAGSSFCNRHQRLFCRLFLLYICCCSVAVIGGLIYFFIWNENKDPDNRITRALEDLNDGGHELDAQSTSLSAFQP